eukprot:10796-Heterococcus_DN1.PRE.2
MDTACWLLLLVSRYLQYTSAAPCNTTTLQQLTVRTSAEAEALARAVACEGGSFEVIWSGNILLSETITIAASTSLKVRAAKQQQAIVRGGGSVRLFDFAGNGTLYLEGLVLRDGYVQGSGGAVNAAIQGSFLSLTDCSFFNNTAREYAGTYTSFTQLVQCL